ncbi:hypothetical protein GCM10017655_05080 [Pseudomonas turukhanskensis]|uniref:Uncharacterized protein n=1 Tax=Pseudomonas turukhanskensis TaxID=1806536 RepID=A0A9W6NED0_9PSED|nr:hypothetical protein GCM10017655_05080 [Pseudomonas turukhanskensis]
MGDVGQRGVEAVAQGPALAAAGVDVGHGQTPCSFIILAYLRATWLLAGLAGIELGDHQRFTLKWAVAICLCILVAALLMGIFPVFGG